MDGNRPANGGIEPGHGLMDQVIELFGIGHGLVVDVVEAGALADEGEMVFGFLRAGGGFQGKEFPCVTIGCHRDGDGDCAAGGGEDGAIQARGGAVDVLPVPHRGMAADEAKLAGVREEGVEGLGGLEAEGRIVVRGVGVALFEGGEEGVAGGLGVAGGRGRM